MYIIISSSLLSSPLSSPSLSVSSSSSSSPSSSLSSSSHLFHPMITPSQLNIYNAYMLVTKLFPPVNQGDCHEERLAGEYYCEQMLQLYVVMMMRIVMMMIRIQRMIYMLNSDDITTIVMMKIMNIMKVD